MSSDLKDRLKADLITARKARDKARTLVLSTVLADIRYKEIDLRADVGDDAVIEVLSKGIKQRKDASEQMRAADRAELADVEDAQAVVLAEYLPEGMSEDEVRALADQVIGQIIGKLLTQKAQQAA